MTLTTAEVIREAVGLFRGSQGQPDQQAREDAQVAINAQDWSNQDKQVVRELLEDLLKRL